MLNRKDFEALFLRLLNDEEPGFKKEGAPVHFGKQELYYIANKLYGEPQKTVPVRADMPSVAWVKG